ncbi:MAG: hypothetical protein SOU95_03120 [Candidatus Cryptobacteroides sp.]|nr:hypothetical protein [Bacteroidales bacterium]MDY2773494.1 hypothetical protein [Candidatus Cryptobacteroides sp.]
MKIYVNYEAPSVETVEITNEEGFATSGKSSVYSAGEDNYGEF